MDKRELINKLFSIEIDLESNFAATHQPSLDSDEIEKQRKSIGGIPYTAHGGQITPPPLFLSFVCFYAYFRLG